MTAGGATAIRTFNSTAYFASGGFASLVIEPDNVAPVAVADFFSVSANSNVTMDVLENDSDPDDDPLTISAIHLNGERGTLIDNGDGTLSYDPSSSFYTLLVGETAEVTYTYTISDGEFTSMALVTLTIVGALSADPFASNNSDVLVGTEFSDEINALSGDDELYGLEGADVLNGGSGDDTLDGGFGADELSGRNGNDTQSGGGGADTFLYVDANEGADIITDFTQGEDIIDLRLADVTGLAGLGIDIATSPGDTVLTFGTTQITLEGVTSPLLASDFIFQGDGTEGDDVINGSRNDETFKGLGGNDRGGRGISDQRLRWIA